MVSLLPYFIDRAVTEQLRFKETLSIGKWRVCTGRKGIATVTFGDELLQGSFGRMGKIQSLGSPPR